jgi:hypothetical protein
VKPILSIYSIYDESKNCEKRLKTNLSLDRRKIEEKGMFLLCFFW